MRRKGLLLLVLSIVCISTITTRSRAQLRSGESFLRQQNVTRSRALNLRLPSITEPVAGAPMNLDLFPDVSLSVRFDETRTQSKGTTAWFGRIEGADRGSAVLVQTPTGWTGAFTHGDGKLYKVRTAEDGTQWVMEIDQSRLPDETDPITVPDLPASKAATNIADPEVYSDDGSIIDVMILYTAAARVAAGGTTAMQQEIQLGIALTNQGYASSGVVQRVRLVDSREINYTEGSSISTDLTRLRTAGDGYLDEVDSIRNSVGADLVSLWVSTSESTCGIGYELNDPTAPVSSLATLAFSVAEENCAVDNFTFSHEMGHNMGANHGRDDVDSNGNAPRGAYPYAFGYKQTTGSNRFRTIMAYDANCSCPRVNYWSNPAVQYLGFPTGVDPNATNSAANYLVLNNTRSIVANYRNSLAGAADTTPPLLTVTSHTNGQTVSASSITLAGTATDAGRGNSGIAAVYANGIRASNDTATTSNTANWSVTLSLAQGANTITVAAGDGAGNVTTISLTINASYTIVSGTSTTSGTYHVFPQFADGRFSDGTYYRTTLMISNPSSTAGATCTLQLRGFSVPGFNTSYPLGPSGWVIASTTGSQSFQSGYATLSCTATVEAQLLYSYYLANGQKASEATVFSSPPASSVRVIADEREGAQVGLAIANDSDSTVTYTVSVGNLSGNVTLTPRTSVARFLNQYVSGLPPNSLVFAQVSSTSGTASIIGLRYTGRVFTTLPESTRSSVGRTASTYHVFPQFADGRFGDGSYFRTTRMFLNSGGTNSDCTTQLRGMTTNDVGRFTASVAAGGGTISSTSGTQALQSGYATVQCTSSVDAQALYSFYAANGVKLSEATVFSSPSARIVQILADNREGSRTAIAIANDTDQTNTYTVTAANANGNVVGTFPLTLNARSAVARFVDELIALPPNYYGQVIVSSDTATASLIGLRFTGSAFTTIPQTIR